MRARSVTVAFLVGSDRHLRGMRMHRTIGENDFDVAAAGAARLPFRQRERTKIGHKVGLPHVLSRPDRQEVTLAGEIALASDTLGKRKWIVEKKALVAKHVEQERQVIGGNKPNGLGA